MSQKSSIKKVFPGGNTSKGFYSFYEYIMPENVKRIFILKGGPGVGKSNFMRRVGEEFARAGYHLEHHHCSSDNDSLDGVVIKGLNVVLVDGTAPHIFDPKHPGAIDEILNLGECWNAKGLEKNREEIVYGNKQISMRFFSAYRYLKAAREMQDDMEVIINEGVDWEKVKKLKLLLRSELVDSVETIDTTSRVRHLFDSGITPEGLVDYIETIIPEDYECYFLKGGTATVSSEILSYLVEEYNMKGYAVELYHQPMNPERLQTLVVEKLKIGITVNPKMEAEAHRIVDIGEMIDTGKYEDKKDLLAKDNEVYMKMLEEGVNRIKQAKLLHDDMEKLYVEHMDFDAVAEIRNRTIESIREMSSS